MMRASQVGCNTCNARIQRVLHRICYSYEARLICTTFVMRTHGRWNQPLVVPSAGYPPAWEQIPPQLTFSSQEIWGFCRECPQW
jgi:hypothetical protein